MNYRVISYALGWVMNIEAFAMLLPLACSFVYNEPNKWVFFASAIICALVGKILTIKKPKNNSMFAKEGFVIVALSWILISVFGALPFVFSKSIPNYIDALFETASGFTTTGASILTDVEILPKSVIFWRSFTHWIGGMGVIVFLVAIMSLFGGNNFYLVRAESPGHSVGKLVPRVKTTAKILYGIYIGLTLLQFILLIIGGLDWFESATLTFGTAGTGGFGIKNSSIAEYTSYQQNVITIFMFIFGIDFSFYYLLIMRKFKNAFKMEEVRVYVIIVIVSILLIFLNIKETFTTVAEALKHSAFQVASIITTTGYSSVDFDLWPAFSKTILVGLMFMGACTGSTGGGMKVSRIMILFKSVLKEIKVLVHPKAIEKIKLNEKPLEHETLRSINVYFVAYMFIFVFAMLIISFDNFDFTTNFTAVLASISNIGPGLSKVGPACNFSGFSNLSKIVLSLVMITGRLEIFPILVLFSRRIWKK